MHEIASIGFLPSAYRQGLSSKEHDTHGVRRNESVEGRFVSLAKDGTLTVWNNNLTIHKVIVVNAVDYCYKT